MRIPFARIFLAFWLPAGAVPAGDAKAAGPWQSWWEGSNATGDWHGARTALQDRGVELTGTYYAEVWGNPAGGFRSAAVYDGLVEFGATVDLERLIGWHGATFQSTWAWFSGQDLSAEGVGNFMTISGIFGEPTLRNYELWLEQKFFGELISVRVGQMGADTEFSLSSTASFFINGTFGWAPFLYMNLPNGGPGLPMGIPGVRLQVQPADWLLYRGAVFQGNVFAQDVNRYGFRWRLNAIDGFFSMHELVFSWQKTALPGAFKAGGWFQTGQYANPLAASTSSGNYGFYFIVDQAVFQEPAGSADGKAAANSGQGLGWFGRIAFAPPDRNYVDFYFDTGVVYTGLIPTRDADQAGLAFAYAQASGGAQNQIAEGGDAPAGAEMALEATYSAQITPWLAIQPDLQFIINPGATRNTPNAFVIGCRSTITF